MSKTPKRPRDPNQLAKQIVEMATGEAPRDPEMEALTPAQELGQSGGAARARKLAPQRRVEIAKKAAFSRWAKKVAPEPTE